MYSISKAFSNEEAFFMVCAEESAGRFQETLGIESPNDQDVVYDRYEKLKKQVLRYNLEKKPEKLDEITEIIYRELEYGRLVQQEKNVKK